MEKEPFLFDYFVPGQPGYLVNLESRESVGAGETLDEWIIGCGKWPGAVERDL